MNFLAFSAATCLLLESVVGHGHLTVPPSRNGGSLSLGGDCTNGACFWFSNNVEIPGKATLDPKHRSLQLNVTMNSEADVFKTSPWRAPGTAKVYGRGCGAAGGGPTAFANGGVAPTGIKQGMDGVDLPKLSHVDTKWKRGSVQEVGFAIAANHGGGYSWRLCKNDDNVSEECFQANVLKFSGENSFVAYPDGRRVAFPTQKVTDGVYPKGSEWALNPIPGCYECDAFKACGEPLAPVPMDKNSGGKNMTCWEDCMHDNEDQLKKDGCSFPLSKAEPKSCWTAITKTCADCNKSGKDAKWDAQVNCYAFCDGSSASKPDGSCPDGTAQFPELSPGISGFGKSVWEWSIVDHVEVPKHLDAGSYLLSWRWDCEESTQVWQNCADVELY